MQKITMYLKIPEWSIFQSVFLKTVGCDQLEAWENNVGDLTSIIIFFFLKKTGTFLVDQQLRLLTFTAGGMGLIPGQGTKVPPAGGDRETE